MPVIMEQGELATGAQTDHTFTNPIVRVGVFLTKFDLGFGRPEAAALPAAADHHVKDVHANISIVNQDRNRVTVKAEGGIVDSSGNSGGGTIRYVVVAETE